MKIRSKTNFQMNDINSHETVTLRLPSFTCRKMKHLPALYESHKKGGPGCYFQKYFGNPKYDFVSNPGFLVVLA